MRYISNFARYPDGMRRRAAGALLGCVQIAILIQVSTLSGVIIRWLLSAAQIQYRRYFLLERTFLLKWKYTNTQFQYGLNLIMTNKQPIGGSGLILFQGN